ncbi:MAG: DUF1801 domain-containing protein [Chitinophagaceae bacterium]|nr:DUF1801 domain-containing protein [Chitinophagaceae bacterium]
MKAGKRPSPYGPGKFVSIEDYHNAFSPEVVTVMDKLRNAIREAAPLAEETISYNMPAFRQGKILVYYAANKQHLGFYPTPGPIQAFADELSAYQTSKGAIQFPYDKPLPVGLIRKIVAFRIAEVEGKASS